MSQTPQVRQLEHLAAALALLALPSHPEAPELVATYLAGIEATTPQTELPLNGATHAH